MYEKVRTKRVEFEEALNDYTVFLKVKTDDSSESFEKHKETELFLKSKTKFVHFYNEIEVFCAKIIDGSITSEEYIVNEVIPSLKKDMVRQAQFFGFLNQKAKELDLPPIPKPEPEAYKNYNNAINKYFSNDTTWFKELEKIRNANSFLY